MSRRTRSRSGLPVSLTVLIVIAVVFIVGLTMGDYLIDELANPRLSKLADSVYDLSIAYVVAYIFFYLTVQRKYDRELPSRRMYVSTRLGNILQSGDTIMSELREQARLKQCELDAHPSDEQLKYIAGRINPKESFSTIKQNNGVEVDWYEAINLIFDHINQSKQEIILLSPEIDVSLIALLDELTDSPVRRLSRLSHRESPENLEKWDFHTFFATLEKIRERKDAIDKTIPKN